MISTSLLLSNLFADVTDEQVYQFEVDLAIHAEDLGFDAIWAVEHHFDSYAMCPSNIQLMSYIAGRTKKMKLGLGAVILPWHDPLRVIENVAMLDIQSGGRVLLGFGRGLARVEYDGFRQNMEESRERFDEAAKFVVDALESGVAEFNGKYYQSAARRDSSQAAAFLQRAPLRCGDVAGVGHSGRRDRRHDDGVPARDHRKHDAGHPGAS